MLDSQTSHKYKYYTHLSRATHTAEIHRDGHLLKMINSKGLLKIEVAAEVFQ